MAYVDLLAQPQVRSNDSPPSSSTGRTFVTLLLTGLPQPASQPASEQVTGAAAAGNSGGLTVSTTAAAAITYYMPLRGVLAVQASSPRPSQRAPHSQVRARHSSWEGGREEGLAWLSALLFGSGRLLVA